MNREEIIQIATESWLTEYGRTLLLRGFDIEINIEELERFAALVAAAEREACADTVWPKLKVWSEEELTAMTLAFNRAQEKHGWYETLMAVGAAALKNRAAAIRARGNT